ncbi:MAG: long-chain fatty acid--CoA ligase, partial [Oxalobacteraceae bacterium]|nr:long-chain fatty acid--CoA ligase [Oxalobacteraceae bacterium]
MVLHHFDGAEPLLPDLLDGHAKWRATRPAVRFEEQSLTWGEFGAAAHRTARSFLNSGVVRGDRVAVLMDNSIEMIETLFGALRAG